MTNRFVLFFSRIAILLSFLFISPVVFSQNKKDLEKKKEQLRKDIEYTNQLLSQTKKNKSTSLSQLITLNKKISYRSELINTINDEIGGLDNSIGGINRHIDSLETRMTELKKQYAGMLYFAYKNQAAYSKLSFIFSARDFNQAYKRLKYLQQLSAYRIQQRNLIEQTQDSLAVRKNDLLGVRTEKSHLLTSQEKEKKNLDQEKKEQVSALNNLASREKKLRADLKEKQKQEEKLNRAIEDIIRKEIESAKLAARKKSSSTLTASVSKKPETITSAAALTSTPEALKLSNDFASNKGKLPWPVDQGFITSTFGRHYHPVWKDVVVNNNGVDINSQKGAKARAIFDGKVVRVIMVVDKYAVLVQHGEYFTLYSNLRDVSVKAGDRVTTKQTLGLVQTDEDDGKTEVHLEIWKGSNKMDPENWIMARR
ncbi:MAG: peptidoglycan DD-metalloendopeptidase family protein [Bacteroidetes bacterium]|nr:peptidoglycan DD-metalloendopeptidase family protein [Bacteroidota bacterium]